jgi:integrase
MSNARESKAARVAERAVDGSRRKKLTRRRHQNGMLLKLRNGWACRYYEPGEGQRRRVQVWLGENLTKPQAKSAMQLTLAAVNQNPVAQPQQSPITFREHAKQWISDCETRKLDPIKASVLHNWRLILANHLLDDIGDLPLASVGNKTMKSLVERLAKKGLAPATIRNICLVVKLVRSSVTDDEGTELFPIKWNKKIIDAPKVDKRKQRKPSFVGEQVTRIVVAATRRMQMIAILLAASGLRMGELTGLECRHFNGVSVKVEQAVWGGDGEVGTPKTENAYRTIDLAPDICALLQAFIGKRKAGFIFQSSSGRPLAQSNILRREFHPLLKGLKIEPCGFHAFRRFRNTFLRQSHCPDGILKYWMGHADEDMTDNYDRSSEDTQYRADVAKAMGVGFDVPKTLTPTPKKKISSSDVISLIGRCVEPAVSA